MIQEGVRINPHYRKITPMVADELARWGEWRNATWIWESVLASRPHVVALLTNAARGHITMGDTARAAQLLDRAIKLQPRAPSVRSLEIIVLGRLGQEERALQRAHQSIDEGIYDNDLVTGAFILGWRAGQFEFAARAMALRMQLAPTSKATDYAQLGKMYAIAAKDDAKAMAAFREALSLANETQRPVVLNQIPSDFRARLGLPAMPSTPASATQTSASKG